MLFFNKVLFVSILTLTSLQISNNNAKIQGLRVDTGYFYDLYPGLSVAEIASDVVSKAAAGGVNTLFIYAYNPVYGALYPTDYEHTAVEGSYGRVDILKELSSEAKKFGIKVIASVPVNNFKDVWIQNPSWRAKTRDGKDYIPDENMYLLSAWHPEFRAWLAGFYKDLIGRNIDIDGIEAVEPLIDYRWQSESDYNLVANQKFKALYPKGRLGDENWLNFRAQGLTDLIGIMNSAANLYRKDTYLIYAWPTQPDGKLISDTSIKEHTGLNLEGILNLRGRQKLKYLTAELIWQQMVAESGQNNMPIEWTREASLQFIDYVNSRALPIIHVEVTPFSSAEGGVVAPTLSEFSDTLVAIRDLKAGIDVYDYSQIEYLSAWNELLSWQ